MTKPVQEYIIRGLEASPVVMSHMMLEAAPAMLDRKPDPERFSLREVVAHLDDWESVWMMRVDLLLDNDNPKIESYDPDARAEKGQYGKADPAKAIQSFARRRTGLVEKLKKLSDQQWQRKGQHTVFGEITVQDVAQIALGHDGYHLKQLAEWIAWKK